jgi:hypothetical protein
LQEKAPQPRHWALRRCSAVNRALTRARVLFRHSLRTDTPPIPTPDSAGKPRFLDCTSRRADTPSGIRPRDRVQIATCFRDAAKSGCPVCPVQDEVKLRTIAPRLGDIEAEVSGLAQKSGFGGFTFALGIASSWCLCWRALENGVVSGHAFQACRPSWEMMGTRRCGVRDQLG